MTIAFGGGLFAGAVFVGLSLFSPPASSSSSPPARRHGAKKSNGICLEFFKGKCKRGSACPYSHDLNPGPEICRDYQNGRCHRGRACKYSHGTQPKPLPKLKLVYFPVRAKAEMIRMCLEFAKISYEFVDAAQYFGVQWSAGGKGQAPFGQLPLLEVDGEVLAQSGSIMRYVARLAGLTPKPKDQFKFALCDSIFEAAQDLAVGDLNVNPIVNVYTGLKFQERKRTYLKAFPAKAAFFAKFLGGQAFFLGENPFYCDFAVYHVLSNTLLLDTDALTQYPSLEAFMSRVASLPGIEDYLERRPKCEGIGVKPMLAT